MVSFENSLHRCNYQWHLEYRPGVAAQKIGLILLLVNSSNFQEGRLSLEDVDGVTECRKRLGVTLPLLPGYPNQALDPILNQEGCHPPSGEMVSTSVVQKGLWT